jgi:hypothetical protein
MDKVVDKIKTNFIPLQVSTIPLVIQLFYYWWYLKVNFPKQQHQKYETSKTSLIRTRII